MTFIEKLKPRYKEMLELRESLGYSHDIARAVPDFLDFCVREYPECNTITREMFESFLDVIVYNTSGTRSNAVSKIRGFMRYLQSEGENVFIPGDEYSIKVERFVPYIFTDNELRKLFESIDNIFPINSSPDREFILPVLFRMMYCCGMRPSEPPSILTEDINLKSGEIYIRQSKGYKDRRILISEDLLNLCKEYAAFMTPTKYFFERKSGERITSRWIKDQFCKCWQRTELSNRTGKPRPFDLRHNFATRTMSRWIEERKDIHALSEYLSAYMGHTEFSMTMYYIHLIPERLLKNPGIDWQRFSSIYPEVYRAKS